MTTKPREYWLHLSGDDKQWYVADHVGSHDFDLHAIEAAPLLAKIARLERLEKIQVECKIELINDKRKLEAALQKCKEQLDEVHLQFWDDVCPEWVFEQDNAELDSILESEHETTPITTDRQESVK